LQSRRIHPNLRIDQHIQLLVDDGARPMSQVSSSLFEVRSERFRQKGFAILATSEIESVNGKALPIQHPEPALHDGIPYGVVPKIL